MRVEDMVCPDKPTKATIWLLAVSYSMNHSNITKAPILILRLPFASRNHGDFPQEHLIDRKDDVNILAGVDQESNQQALSCEHQFRQSQLFSKPL